MGVSFILKKVQVKESFLTDKSLSNTLKSEGKYQCSPITIPACLLSWIIRKFRFAFAGLFCIVYIDKIILQGKDCSMSRSARIFLSSHIAASRAGTIVNDFNILL